MEAGIGILAGTSSSLLWKNFQKYGKITDVMYRCVYKKQQIQTNGPHHEAYR